MRTLPARHSAAGASVLVMAAGTFTVPAAASVAGGPRPRGPTCSLGGVRGERVSDCLCEGCDLSLEEMRL